MNDLSGRIIRKSLNGSSESTLRRFIGNEKGTEIYWKRVKKGRRKKEGGGKYKLSSKLAERAECIYALSRRYISREPASISPGIISC